MNIFGVGGAELVLIFVIMLVVAGPKRMLRWAYVFGQFLGKLRLIWDNVMEIIQAEVNAAGMDVEIPRELPTRGSVTKWLNDQTRDVTNPLQDDFKEIDGTISRAKRDLGEWNQPANGSAIEPARNDPPAQTSSAGQTRFGSWTASDDDASQDSDTTDNSGFGAWANPQPPGQTRQQPADEKS